MGCYNDLFGIWSQTLQRHVLYISETYNILMKKTIIRDLICTTVREDVNWSLSLLFSPCRYTTKHLNDESTNKTIKSMLQ